MLDKNVDSHGMLIIFLIDHKRFLVKPMIRSNLGDFGSIVVLQLVDVPDNLAFVCTDSSEEQQVLEIPVITERRRLNNDLLQKLNKLKREVGSQEGLDGDGDIIWVRTLRQSGCDDLGCSSILEWEAQKIMSNLVNQSTPVHVIRLKNLSPEIRLATFHEVSRLLLEHRILVGNSNQLLITESFGIGDICQVRITGFAEFTNNKRFVKLETP